MVSDVSHVGNLEVPIISHIKKLIFIFYLTQYFKIFPYVINIKSY